MKKTKIKIGLITIEKHDFGITINAAVYYRDFSGFLRGNGNTLELAIADLLKNMFALITKENYLEYLKYLDEKEKENAWKRNGLDQPQRKNSNSI